MRIKIQLACTDCKRKNYPTEKNKKNTTGKMQIKKYCPYCDSHKVHKETK